MCAPFDAAGQPLEKRVLMECQTRFYEVVAAKDIYRELCQKKVIPQTVADQIKSHSVEEARGHLFDHMRDYGTIDTLKLFCDVITSEKYDGFQAMQDFGSEMKRRLEEEGRCMYIGGWLWWCTDLRYIVWANDVRERELELLMTTLTQCTCILTPQSRRLVGVVWLPVCVCPYPCP